MARLADTAPARFLPAVDGLAHVVEHGRADAAGRRFYGWAAGTHWYLDD
ncbi:MAG TPA: hypothetical protein VHV74_05915 [Pseudonocardiaceae bacterium]|nr:hypothetical protein [Pseudonocardiaceae bacterium]